MFKSVERYCLLWCRPSCLGPIADDYPNKSVGRRSGWRLGYGVLSIGPVGFPVSVQGKLED